MKTKQQILEWLKAQEWYEAFKRETQRKSRVSVEEYVEESEADEFIILCSFIWGDTDEGGAFWDAAHKEYLKFLYDEQD